jgi:hypothetical protein
MIKKFTAIMEPEGSLLCLKEPATRPCNDPDESSSHTQALVL